MLGLPKSTEYNKRIPKTQFYRNLDLPNKVKQQFADEIDTIIWQNKISQDTMAVSVGEEVTEIEIIEIRLRQKGISKNILEIMDRGIPYHIVFLLTFKGEAQIAIGYKDKSQKKDAKYRVEGYYFSEWASTDEFVLELKGLNLDRIYENLLRRFIPKERPQVRDLRETIALQKEIEKQAALCESIEKRMKNESQFNLQVELNRKLREEKAKLNELLSLNNLEGTR
jgi:hypothetical protein